MELKAQYQAFKNMSDVEIADLADAIFFHLGRLYQEKSGDDPITIISTFNEGNCWYVAKTLKYLLPALTIMEYGQVDHYWVKIGDYHINSLNLEQKDIYDFGEVSPETYIEVDKNFIKLRYINLPEKGPERHIATDQIFLSFANKILNDEYYQEKLGNVRGDVPFHGLESTKNNTNHKRGTI